MRAVLNKWRVVLLIFSFFVIAGSIAINDIPKEETPDVSIPTIYVSITLNGISAEDADSLLIQPVQKHLSTINGVKAIKSVASVGRGTFTIEFNSDIELDQALTDVQRAVDKAENELPADADKPNITEVNLSLMPIITISITGYQNESILLNTAKYIQDTLEALPRVLEAEIKGARSEVLEIIVDPEKINALNLDLQDVFTKVSNNNTLIAAGAVDNESGRFNLKVPGLIDSVEMMENLPIRIDELKTLKLKDLAKIQLGFEQASSVAYMDGQRAILLEVKKRIGENLIATVEDVKATIEVIKPALPSGVDIKFSLDSSKNIKDSLADLTNNIIFATILVMLVILVAIGTRNSILVGIAIPGSFLAALFVLNLIGFTLNIVVLFSLILSVGLLVDSAIVITEASSRYLSLGKSKMDAYVQAVKELGFPIISSTITTLSVFFPLLFWPGIIGEFMFYLPSTLIVILSAALLISLIVIPSFGLIIPYHHPKTNEANHDISENNTYYIDNNQFDKLTGFIRFYYLVVKKVIHYPLTTLLVALVLFASIFIAYGKYNAGTIFFPNIEPENGFLQIKARSNLSLIEREKIAMEVNNRLLSMGELQNVYTVAEVSNRNDKDLIAQINYEFADWFSRRKSVEINKTIEELVSDIPGVIIEIREQERGPPGGDSDINILIQSNLAAEAKAIAEAIQNLLLSNPGLKDVKNDYFQTDREWQLVIDREKAAEFGLDIATASRYISMVTNGLKVGDFYTDLSDDSMDIKLLYQERNRNINQIQNIKIARDGKLVPLSNFATIQSAPASSDIKRTDGIYAYRVYANTKDGYNTNKLIDEATEGFKSLNIPNNVRISFEGEAEQQAETSAFLIKAFGTAIFIMFLVLMFQFNRFYQSFLILSAIVFSTGGVLIGFLISKEPFVIVMGGIGIISLAGVVVNNNIILISSYNQFIEENYQPVDAVIKSCLTRIRPVLLTAFTTVLGLLPMVYQISINLLDRDILFDSPSSQWWVALSTTIAGGLSIATLITLLFIPAMLTLPHQFIENINKFKQSIKKPKNKSKPRLDLNSESKTDLKGL